MRDLLAITKALADENRLRALGLLRGLLADGERARAREYAAWLLGAAGGYAIKIVNPGAVPTTYPGAAIALDQVSDTVVSDNEVILGKGNASKSVSLIGGCDPDTIRIDNNQTSRTP